MTMMVSGNLESHIVHVNLPVLVIGKMLSHCIGLHESDYDDEW